MPKYTYRKVAQNDGDSSGVEMGTPSKSTTRVYDEAEFDGDDLAHRRLPTCLSLLILLTIVYVLSRTSGSSTCTYDVRVLKIFNAHF